jgi:hypothetical protein
MNTIKRSRRGLSCARPSNSGGRGAQDIQNITFRRGEDLGRARRQRDFDGCTRPRAVKPGSSVQLAELNGLKTVGTLLKAGADMESAVPMG